MADEDRQSDKMVLTVHLVVLLVRKIEKIEKKKALSQSLQSPLVFYPCFSNPGISHIESQNMAIAQEASLPA